jgi:hypothetical protein
LGNLKKPRFAGAFRVQTNVIASDMSAPTINRRTEGRCVRFNIKNKLLLGTGPDMNVEKQ